MPNDKKDKEENKFRPFLLFSRKYVPYTMFILLPIMVFNNSILPNLVSSQK